MNRGPAPLCPISPPVPPTLSPTVPAALPRGTHTDRTRKPGLRRVFLYRIRAMSPAMLRNEDILFQDDHLLVLNKPAGVPVHGSRMLEGRPTTLLALARDLTGRVVHAVHRLDRPTSGVLVFARTSKALTRMNALFKEKEVCKTYWALVSSPPPEESGRLVHWLQRNPKQNKSNPAPRCGGLVPPLGPTLRVALTVDDCTHPLVSLRERSLTIAWSRPECRQASLPPHWRLSRRPFYVRLFKK